MLTYSQTLCRAKYNISAILDHFLILNTEVNLRFMMAFAEITNLGYKVCSQVSIPQLFQKIFKNNYLTILMYHAVVRDPLEVSDYCFVKELSFREQMIYLRKHFTVLPLNEAIRRSQKNDLRSPTASITFDDGFQNNYDVAFPILRELGLPATIFLCTGLINTDDTFWYCRLNLALANTQLKKLNWHDYRFDISEKTKKNEVHAFLKNRLKMYPQRQLIRELHQIIIDLGDNPEKSIEQDSPFRLLCHESIAEMYSSGLIDYGSHSHTHAILNLVSKNKRHYELEQPIKVIKYLTGRPPLVFAYPNGEHNDEIISLLQEFGINYALTTIKGGNNNETDPMKLRRYGIGVEMRLDEFKMTVHHFLEFLTFIFIVLKKLLLTSK